MRHSWKLCRGMQVLLLLASCIGATQAESESITIEGCARLVAAAAAQATSGIVADHAVGAETSHRAVVAIQGGGTTHAFTTPWAACAAGRPPFVQAMVDAGLPVFTAPGYMFSLNCTSGEDACPPQPPTTCQWNTLGYPDDTGEGVLNFLGWLADTYGYKTFDLVGYSYGGVVARATVAALARARAAAPGAPGFSYAAAAAAAGIEIPAVITLNTPHLGSPAYDIASNISEHGAVAAAWGAQFADLALDLTSAVPFNAGALQFLVTAAHAADAPASWDAQQIGALDGVALTLLAGDFCGTSGCGDNGTYPRTDGTVPVYSQLIEECPPPCGPPPSSVHVPPGLVPPGTVRRVFPTVHSKFDAKLLGMPNTLSVSDNPPAIDFLVQTLLGHWAAAGAALLPRGMP